MGAQQLATIMLDHDEGWEAIPYHDRKRYPTIGIGRKIGNKNDPLPLMTTTRQIEDRFLQATIGGLEGTFLTHINTCHIYPKLSDIRKAVLLCMAYQMGFVGILGFRKFWVAVESQNYDDAAKEMLDSEWHNIDSPKRCEREANMMKTNIMDPYYAS